MHRLLASDHSAAPDLLDPGNHAGSDGLYRSEYEHDSCGYAFVAREDGASSHELVRLGLTALLRLDHRGARGAEPSTGDGAGVTIQLPDALLRDEVSFKLPPLGAYAAGAVFLPLAERQQWEAVKLLERCAQEEGACILGWREVPINLVGLGETALRAMPAIRQVFLAAADRNGRQLTDLLLDRVMFRVRKRVEHAAPKQGLELYFPSLSSRTLVYKGMLTPHQLETFYPDLSDERLSSAIALVHSRFSTNTFPSWPLAHPYRFIAHNGEINTISGNRSWMTAREGLLGPEPLGDPRDYAPVCTPDASDSVSFDEVLELLHLGGRSLPHALLMMIPPAWEKRDDLSPQLRAFHQFHACLMEPWDGPACVAFTDGTQVGAVLDRNGLRPGRWWRTHDGLVVVSSEAGVLEIAPERIAAKGRLKPGNMFVVDTAAEKIMDGDEIKNSLAAAAPYQEWLDAGLTSFDELPSISAGARSETGPTDSRPAGLGSEDELLSAQLIFGYTEEERSMLLEPMARDGEEPASSMGTDTPIAVLSQRPRLLYDYFTQRFAQVTNPPLDALREELVTNLSVLLGEQHDLFDPSPASCRRIVLPNPVLDEGELARLAQGTKTARIDGRFAVAGGGDALKAQLDAVCDEAAELAAGGTRLLVLSDRGSHRELAPIPSLLLLAAVHSRLVREKTRATVELVVESGDCRSVHHLALLLTFGAAAVCPYLALRIVEEELHPERSDPDSAGQAVYKYRAALVKGLLKIMSKMGISTVASYQGARICEATGLDHELIARYFPGTVNPLGGANLEDLAHDVARRHAEAWPDNPAARAHRRLDVGGEYHWRREGELHLFNPETVFLLQHAARSKQYDVFRRYTTMVDGLAREAASLRGLFELRHGLRRAVPLEEVEPVESIVRRFATGAMSYGSISIEAHETLAIAMNRLGGRSNTGEGGEESERLADPIRNSAIKQVASGRFGVTSEYLVSASEIQIKMAQGAKPGEGGQLPGKKVWPWIARTRYSIPGVGLISPPPHHDIYSIEDLAQLIFDLKSANPAARISVKLASTNGVGTVAAGVAKARADQVLIAGHDGGTGASPMNSIKHAGTPWELGLAETQQTLMRSRLRDRISVQVDGQLKTGRDVVVAALLGAEEFGFSTAPLVVSGCVMMRVCHLDTCPVGVATQNPELRKRFTGRPEFVENFFLFIAEEVRTYLAELGFRSLDEAIGHAEFLDTRPAIDYGKTRGLDLTPILAMPRAAGDRRKSRAQEHSVAEGLAARLRQIADPALRAKTPVRARLHVRNTDRAVGTYLGSEVTRAFGSAGLPDETIEFDLLGSAGQSFGAFLPLGITLRLFGDANDYAGKGLSGGKLVIRPDEKATFVAEENVIVGNTVLYGATGGQLFCRGIAGERFAVRNSGAMAVVEGVGDHACEYMTGGTVVVLGPVGRNFAAGMSGGVAYAYRLDAGCVNRELVELEALTDTEAETVFHLLNEHLLQTDSSPARELLATWPQARQQFTRVMPRGYQRMLNVIAQAEAAGRDVDAAVMEVVSDG